MKKQRMYSIVIVTALFFMTLFCGFFLQVREAKAEVHTTTHLSVEKTVFQRGEPITVVPTAQTAGARDWVGIVSAERGLTHIYLAYEYIEKADGGAGSGVAIDITKGVKNTANSLVSSYINFPAGNYIIVFVPNNGSANGGVTESINITIEDTTRSTTHLSLQKTVFKQGEAITVTPTVQTAGANDWVGIVSAEPDLDHIYISYQYVETAGSGVSFDITKGTKNTGDALVSGYLDFPAGDYVIVFVPNNGSANGDVTESIAITVEEAVLYTEHLSVAKTAFSVGEAITVAPTVQTAGAKDWVGIVSASATYTSIKWSYIDGTGGAGSGVAIDITKGTTTDSADIEEYLNFPAGEYYLIFVPNNGSASAATEKLKIVIGSSVPDKPSAVSYALTDATSGLAGGTLSVTFANYNSLPSYQRATDIISYWGDQSGTPLAAYTAHAQQKVTGATTQITVYSNTIIPAEAKTLVLYASNASGLSDKYVHTLPANCQYKHAGDMLYEFQVVSDIHLDDDATHLHNRHYKLMLQDVAQNSPDSKGIFVAGDMTETGSDTQYGYLKSIYGEVKAQNASLAPMYLAIGNHEFKDGGLDGYGNYQERIETFIDYASDATYANGAQEKAYFDKWIDGYHYIFLASELCTTSLGKDAYISQTQLEWFEQKLAENYSADRPIFVFLHNSLYNTVSGGLPGQNWNGVVVYDDSGSFTYPSYNVSGSGNIGEILAKEKPFRDLLAEYPEIMMFNGHSHWTLNSKGAMYAADGTLPYIFNTSSVGYLWDDSTGTGVYLKGSEGYYVRVYSDGVEILGRDFTTGKFIPTACFATNTGDLSYHDAHADADGDCLCDYGNEAMHAYSSDCDAVCNNNPSHTRTASGTHTPNSDDGNCTTDILCSLCGATTEVGNSAHALSVGADKDGAYHAVQCTNTDCNYEGEAEHVYNASAAQEQYLKTQATCTAKAEYYQSCACGRKGTATFTHGEVNPLNHQFGTVDECVCGAIKIKEETFSEDWLREWISGQDGNADGILDADELAGCTAITVSGQSISSLAGIERLTDLTTLDCSENTLTALDLSGNTQLSYLDCSGNRLAALDLSGHTSLTTVICGGQSLDITISADATFDMNTLGINLSKVTLVQRQTMNNGIVQLAAGQRAIVYTYATGFGDTLMDVTLNVTNPHAHTFSEQKQDDEYHWNECVCGQADELVEHTGGTATCSQLAQCSVCEREYGSLASHGFTVQQSDQTHHWSECATCGEEDAKEEHAFNSDGTCACGAQSQQDGGDGEAPDGGNGEPSDGGDGEAPDGGNEETPDGGEDEAPDGGDEETPDGGEDEAPDGGGASDGLIIAIAVGIAVIVAIGGAAAIYVIIKKKR